MDKFGVSVPQSSKDLSLYRDLAPQNTVYDRSAKCYLACDSFEPCFALAGADRYLAQLKAFSDGTIDLDDTWFSSHPPSFEVAPLPLRHVKTKVLRGVIAAIRDGRSLEVRYQSLSSVRPHAMWRWISPHALAFDGNRWHMRAFCHLDRTYKDFLLSRTIDVRNSAPSQNKSKEDKLWNSYSTIIIGPDPRLSKEQANVVAQDFKMENGELSINVRTALVYYVLRRLNLQDFGGDDKPIRERPITLLNAAELKRALTIS